MIRFALSLALCAASSTGVALAQGSYTPFGTGCPGTGKSNNTPGLVLPADFRTKVAGGGNYYGVSRNQQRYQQVFLGTDAPKPVVAMGYALRYAHSNSGGTRTYKVTMGYTTYTPSTLTSTFDNNWDKTIAPAVVLNKQVNLPQLPSRSKSIDDWPFQVLFDKPWVYVPRTGINLLWQLEILDTANLVQGYDAGSSPGTTRLYSTSLVATGTLGQSFGLAFKLLTPGAGVNPAIGNVNLPTRGQTMQITLSQAKANSAAGLIMGFSNASWGAIPLPFDLAPLGASGCQLLVSFDLLFVVPTDGSGNASIPLSIPNDPALRNGRFLNQWFVVDAAANSLGLAFSDGAAAVIG